MQAAGALPRHGNLRTSRLGATWLPPQDVEKFVHALSIASSGIKVKYIFTRFGSKGISQQIGSANVQLPISHARDLGTNCYTGLELTTYRRTQSLKTPVTVCDTIDKKPVINPTATEAAREKQERIKEKFKEWVWADDDRRARLVWALLNDTFNHSRVRTFNGEHLTLPGASSAIQLQLHQKAGVWRILQTDNTLLGYRRGRGQNLYDGGRRDGTLKRLGLALANLRSPFPITCLAAMPKPNCSCVISGGEHSPWPARKIL